MRRIPYLLALVPALVLADDVHLKGGAVFSGRIVEETETMVSIDIGGGVVGVDRSRIERIVKGRSALDEYDERASRLKPQDANAWAGLGRWAAEQGLSAQSRQAYQKVLAVSPDDPEARQAMGFVLMDGRWLTEEESYRAQGYVQYDGEWMTPAEAQVAQQASAAEQARRDAELRAADAEVAAQEAEARAQEAEERAAQQAQNQATYWNYPVYWGNWGYGVTTWPPSTGAGRWPVQRPSTPARVPR
ncbi:MAG: tetratricopeptide repeat protein [Candidatus Polarisedimenticolia bacterium]